MSRLLFLAVIIGLVIAAIYVVPGMTNWNAELDKYLHRSNANNAAQETASRENAQRATKPAANDIIDHRDNLSVDFQGLRLGLPLKELPVFVNQKQWKIVLGGFESSLNLNKLSQEVIIDGVREIGAEADKSNYYNVEGVIASFYNGQLAQITVDGFQYPDFATARRWLDFAAAGLTKKYGHPQITESAIEKLTVASFKPGVFSPFLGWKIGSRLIILGGSGLHGRYMPQVIYTDIKLKEQMETTAKSESNM